jgi:hypothetical protein
MKARRVSPISAVVSVILFSLVTLTAACSPPGEQPAGGQTAAIGSNPRDLSGYWLLSTNTGLIGPNETAPDLTPEGVAAMSGRIPNSAVDFPALSNDPEKECNPDGFPRLLLDSEPIEFLQLEDRLIQFFQWEHRVRIIWLDGREVPSGENLENLGPAWYGHSVGEWEGDTLIVNTVGLDERAWLDENVGRPKSFHARIEERYTLVDANTVEIQLTLDDPEYYTSTWVGNTKSFERLPPEAYTFFGWEGLFAGISEGICAPINEVEGYNDIFRDAVAP